MKDSKVVLEDGLLVLCQRKREANKDNPDIAYGYKASNVQRPIKLKK